MCSEKEKKKKSALFVSSLEKGMIILEAFNQGRAVLGLSDLVSLTGINRSAVQRFLHTWEALGYLEKDPVSKQCKLTPKIMTLGYSYLKSERLVEIATPFLLEARKRAKNSIYLGVLDGDSVVYLLRFPQRLMVIEGTLPGRAVPAFCGGRALLSCLPEQDVVDILQKSHRIAITPHTIVGMKNNMQEIAKVKENGYCISRQEQVMGELAISAPICDSQGTLQAAVYISARSNDWSTAEAQKTLVPIVLETASHIGQAL